MFLMILLSMPTTINQTWLIDFVSDSLNTGRNMRIFNAMDDYNIEFLSIEADRFMSENMMVIGDSLSCMKN
jgi:putative transposase